MVAPIVFFDIASEDTAPLKKFYEQIFDWSPDDNGQFEVPVHEPLQAAIRQDPSEKRLYLGVEDINATLEQITSLGGTVEVGRMEVPGTVVLALFRDPADNPMGLVEMRDGHAVIP